MTPHEIALVRETFAAYGLLATAMLAAAEPAASQAAAASA